MAAAEEPQKLLDGICAITKSLFEKAEDGLILETYFNNTCKGSRTCTIPLKGSPGIFDSEFIPRLKSRCYNMIIAREKASKMSSTADSDPKTTDTAQLPEPVFLAQATCDPGNLNVPLLNIPIPKDVFGICLVLVDFLVIVLIICFIYVLDLRQRQYIKQYKNQTMEMSDYTVRVKNLPNDFEYDGREEILQAHLWSHFTSILGADRT